MVSCTLKFNIKNPDEITGANSSPNIEPDEIIGKAVALWKIGPIIIFSCIQNGKKYSYLSL